MSERGGVTERRWGLFLSLALTHALSPIHPQTHMQIWGPFPTADEFPKDSSRIQDESPVNLLRSDVLGYGSLTHQQSTKTLDPARTRTHTPTHTRTHIHMHACTPTPTRTHTQLR